MTAAPNPNEPSAPVTVAAAPAADWRKLHALGLPAGSVRAILAVMIFAGIWAWLWLRPQTEVPSYLEDLMFIIMGHYFAARARAGDKPEPGPPPLFLPRGSIRFVLVGGFALVGILLIYQRRLWVGDPSAGIG